MCSTPAPPSTACVAASIWSGVGEVKTSPGQAASSMPGPTNPPCIGSWPEPPPETIATLPATGASARAIQCGSVWTTRRPACARAMPASSSLTTSSGRLMSFFIALPSSCGRRSLSGGVTVLATIVRRAGAAVKGRDSPARLA